MAAVKLFALALAAVGVYLAFAWPTHPHARKQLPVDPSEFVSHMKTPMFKL